MGDILTVTNTFNGLIFCLMTMGGWWLRHLQQNLDDLRRKNVEQDESIHIINLQIEREFIRKADVVALMNHLAKQLDRIEQKLDGKADK